MKNLPRLILLLTLILTACAQATPPTPASLPPAPDSVSPAESTADNVESLGAAQGKPDTSHLEPETGYISFIINVHDWTHPGESADILLKLVDLFERYGVRGDFYFTPEITRALAENHPEVIERFRNSNMTISYHVRAPHPLVDGFDAPLQGLDDAALSQTLLDYETYALNLETGELDRSQPGGYTYVAQVFGRKPVVASASINDLRIGSAARTVYASLGAQMTVLYHEEGAKLEQPFEYVNGLLVRPSDFSVTRVTSIDGTDNFWWNFMSRPNAAEYLPVRLLELGLKNWNGQTESLSYSRAPFITALIHENNFVRRGTEGWTSIYYTLENGKRGDPLAPPWNLAAPDPSRLRPPEEQQAIWDAYEELVAYAAANLNVVTSADILKLAQEQK